MENRTPLVDEHLQSMRGMKETGTDDFFYTRLKARMERQPASQGWSFPVKPAWVLGTLALFLIANTVMLARQSKAKQQTSSAANPTLQHFAESYDQTLSNSY